MSAYVVDKETIDQLVSAAIDARFTTLDDATSYGQTLWRENVISVAYRYSLAQCNAAELAEYEGDVEAYEYTPQAAPDTRGIIDAIDNLDYQSCEHDGWQASDAYAQLGKLRIAYPEKRTRRA
jgi:hypothetical protein